jgi:hypothetical protein
LLREVAVEHRARRDVGQAVVGGLAGLRRPFLRLAAGLLVAAPSAGDLDRRDALEIADLLCDLDAGHDGGLRVDYGRIGL